MMRRVFRVDTVEEWLLKDEIEDDDKKRAVFLKLLVKTVSEPLCGKRHVDVARKLLARGADPNKTSYGRVSPLHLAAKAQGVYALDLVETLLAGGADANARTSQSGRNETPLMVAIDQLSLRPSRFPALAVVRALLRGGARIDRICGSEAAQMRMWRIERLRPELCQEQSWLACRDTVDGIWAVGSWKAFVRRPHVELFVLRALVTRDRATTSNASLRWLVTLQNPILWRVLTYWRATS